MKKKDLKKTDRLEPFDPSAFKSVPPQDLRPSEDVRDEDNTSTDQIDMSSIAAKVIRSEVTRKQACLMILNGQELGRMISLESRSLKLGRSPDCDEVLPGEGVSRFHAQITHGDGDSFIIEDLGSTNGTYVQGQRIHRRKLEDGDKIVLGGRTVLKFVLHDEIDETYFQEIFESTTRDDLTGAFNRKYLIQKIIVDLSFSRRHRIPFTLLILDLDFFKKVNDSYGHQTGDQALVTLTRAVQEIIRAEDVLARFGGEEFAVVAPGTDFQGGRVLGERIRRGVAAQKVPIVGDEKKFFHITVSVGVATVHPGTDIDSATIISVADRNLYEAKRMGRNRVITSSIG